MVGSSLSLRSLVANPVSYFTTSFLLAAPMSHLAHCLGVHTERAGPAFEEFGKV